MRLSQVLRLTAVAVLAAAPAAHSQSQSRFTYNGVNLVSYQANEYLNSASAAATLRATGGNYAGLVVTQYMQSSTSNVIAPETSSSPGYIPSSNSLSPTDASLVSAIQSLQAQGLIVSLKPQVDANDGVFRGLLAPSDVAAWFASYQTFILHYAQIAAQNNVGMFVIGTEFKSLSGPAYKAYWQAIITQVRTLYPSLTLTYAANATGAGDEYSTVSFWADLDLIGVDGYVPLTNTNDPSVAQLVAAWTGNKNGFNAVQAFKTLQSTYGKPLIFTEVGYVSVAGTNQIPYSNLSGPFDGVEQQNCYEAFFQVFSQQSDWMKGVFWWAWTVPTPTSTDIGYTPQSKPAASVTLPKWFGSTTPGFTIAPSNSTLLVGQGATATDTIAVTKQGGFSGAVALSLSSLPSGLPSGVSGSFSAGPAGTQLLTLTATSAAALARAQAVTIIGSSGALSASTVVALTVAPGPGFTLASSAAMLSTVQGGTVSTLLTIKPTNGFTGAVALSAAGLPSGVTASFTINPATSTSMLTLSAATGTTVGGPVSVTVTGTSATLSAATTLLLTVTPAPSFVITGPAISIPAGASTGNSSTVLVTPTGGFTGTVQLACTISPSSAANAPSCALQPNSVTLAGTAAQTSTLTVTTTAPTHAANGSQWLQSAAGGTVFACLLCFGFSGRRRRFAALGALALAASLSLSGCGGATSSTAGPGSPGTASGAYVATVTGSSGTTVASGQIALTIQ